MREGRRGKRLSDRKKKKERIKGTKSRGGRKGGEGKFPLQI